MEVVKVFAAEFPMMKLSCALGVIVTRPGTPVLTYDSSGT